MENKNEAYLNVKKLMRKHSVLFFLTWGSLALAGITLFVSAIISTTEGKHDFWFLPHYKVVIPILVLCAFTYFFSFRKYRKVSDELFDAFKTGLKQ